MPKLLIVATLFFFVGLVMIVGGMLGGFSPTVMRIGSALAILAVVLRVASRLLK